MNRISSLGALLLSSALVSPLVSTSAWAQDESQERSEAPVDISAPGVSVSDEVIVVQGRYIPETIRATSEVISVLSAAEIARTGDGDIAGALQRVTGLSLVGGRFVYVRGLGERYSLALLNGLPLPSPEPLRRVVPLDIFPTEIIASSVVQKSYSANYPGEFGGGVINLTTAAIPEESFLKIGGSLSGDSETTFETGYTYYGSQTDWTGFDNGTRDMPRGLKTALNSGQAFPTLSVAERQAFAASLVNAPTTLVQRNHDIPLNGALDISAGLSLDIGSDRLGVIAAFGWDNAWETRGGLNQRTAGLAADGEGGQTIYPNSDFRFMSTENRIVVHGLLGLGYSFGEHTLRWTNLYIRDTVKEARIEDGVDDLNVGSDRLNRSYTSWFERQLIDTQIVGEFKFGDVALDVRGTYANTQREAPYERTFSYRFDPSVGDFTNNLGGQGRDATIAFSDLSEDVWAGSANVSWKAPTARDLTLTAGYAYTDTTRTSTRYDFRYRPVTNLPLAVAQQRPDYLLSDYNIYTYGIVLNAISADDAVRYDAGLRVHAGYVQAETELMDFLRATVGVRYETADQFVQTFGANPYRQPNNNDYWLPAATLTWNFTDDMQLRFAASKTIARPQFRELSPIQYRDTESERLFIGNIYLTDSELLNLEARYEWYMGRNERFSVAGFYKKIDKPVEAISQIRTETLMTTYANAPEAVLYGGEIEVQKYFPLSDIFGEGFFSTRDLLIATNYTYTQSQINVGAGDTTIPPDTAGVVRPASDYFRDGTPMTGQSDHIANIQIGFEDSESLSQQTLMLTYSSKRILNRFTSDGQAIDFLENPGIRLDFVARQGFTLAGKALEFKFEARNLTKRGYSDYQEFNGARIDRNTYDVGRSFSLGLSATF